MAPKRQASCVANFFRQFCIGVNVLGIIDIFKKNKCSLKNHRTFVEEIESLISILTLLTDFPLEEN